MFQTNYEHVQYPRSAAQIKFEGMRIEKEMALERALRKIERKRNAKERGFLAALWMSIFH